MFLEINYNLGMIPNVETDMLDYFKHIFYRLVIL